MSRLLTFIIGIISCLNTTGQNTFLAFTRYTIDDGLASTITNAVYQDYKGFMWIGTGNGLQRFDGRKFVNFGTNPQGDPLPQASVSQIVGLPDSTLMILCNDIKEIGIFNPAKFLYKKIPVKTSSPVWPRANYKLHKDGQGNVFLMILKYHTVLWYDKAENIFTEKKLPLQAPGHNWLVSSFWIDTHKNQYWYSCDSGLAVYDASKKQLFNRYNNPLQLRILSDPAVNEKNTLFFGDRKNRYWIINWPAYAGGGEVMHCFDTKTGQYTKDTLGWGTAFKTYSEKSGMAELKDGSIWIYGAMALAGNNNDERKFINNRTQFVDNFGIRYENVSQIYEDNEGGLWVATDQGLYYSYLANDDAVLNFMLSDGNAQISPTGFTQLKNNEILMTTWGNSVMSFSNDMRLKAPLLEKSKEGYYKLTWCAVEDKITNKIYIGCQSGGIIIFDPVTKQNQLIVDSIFEGKTIRQIVQDKKGTLYFGTQYGKIVRYKEQKFSVVKQLTPTIIQKMLLDEEGMLWAGTFNDGIYVINPETGETIFHYFHDDTNPAQSLYNNIVVDLEQSDSLIYAATGALSIINKKTKTVSVISTQNGLPSNSVKQLEVDGNKNVWFTTVSGLIRYNPLNKSFTSFGKKDAIANAELLVNPSYKLNDGRIVFSSSEQLLILNPEKMMTTSVPPDVTITDFKLLDEFLPVDSLLHHGVKLKYFQNTLSISFASLSFQQRDKLIYYYKLDGIDKEWTRADANLTVRYSLLPPGKYHFLVKCKNSDGVESKNITSFPLIIHPPFWRTGWFISSVLFVIALFIYVLHNLRVTKLLAVEKLRNRVARDLHDDMGSTLSTINILSSMAKTRIATDPVKTSEYINKISDNSQRMMEAMDDIVWAIKPANDSMEKIVARMREFATNVLEAKEIDYEFKVDETINEVSLNMEQRRDLFLLFKEAVNNVAKYSQCKNASINITVKEKKLLLLVKDDGIGFDVKSADSGNGLGNMLKRADALHGRVDINSAIGIGTEVKLSVPIY